MGEVVSESFHHLIGMAHARNHALDLEYLGLSTVDMHDLEAIFMKDEV